MSAVRRCRDDERAAVLAIINAAAEAYRGVIPADRWHAPYMSSRELEGEIASGVVFWGYEADGALVGIMGIQAVRDVDLIRHAYVAPASQSRGVGGALLAHLSRSTTRRILVGTWAAAEWAIRFYRRHGFELVSPERAAALLKAYWIIPDRQIETSVVLAKPPLDAEHIQPLSASVRRGRCIRAGLLRRRGPVTCRAGPRSAPRWRRRDPEDRAPRWTDCAKSIPSRVSVVRAEPFFGVPPNRGIRHEVIALAWQVACRSRRSRRRLARRACGRPCRLGDNHLAG